MKEVVAAGTTWNAFKALTRPNEETLAVLESGSIKAGEPTSISEMLRVGYHDFYNFHRKNPQKCLGLTPIVGRTSKSMES